jgi:N12 class adenine-specific DNA methylase
MTPLENARSKIPALAGLSDEQAIDVLQQTYYKDMTREQLAEAAGVKLSGPAAEGRTLGGTAKDIGITALKSAIGVPEVAVGLADLVSGGQAGKLAEEYGFRPKEAKAMLDEGYSPSQKEAFRKVQAAEGLGDTFMAAVQNPSVIGHSVVESLPLMGAGGVVARGGMAMLPRAGAVVAGAAGEGIVGAGSAAEQIRQQTSDGLLTGTQAGLAAASGGATAMFGLLGGKIAQKLGIADVDTMLAGAATNPAVRKGVVRSALEGAFSEGFLEELPQSISEQVLQNIALDRPLDEGVNQAAVLGLLSGGAMGAGANVVSSLGGKPQSALDNPAVAPPQQTPPAGPLSRAASKVAPVAAATGLPGSLTGETPQSLLAYPENDLLAAAREREKQTLTGHSPAELMVSPENQLLVAMRSNEDAAADQVMSKAVVNQVPPADPRATEKQDQPAGSKGQFKSADEAKAYISQQRRAAGINLPKALPVEFEDGSHGVAIDGGPDFAEAQRQDKARRLLAAGVQEGDLLNPAGDIIKTKAAANTMAKKEGGEVIPVTGGFVVRKKAGNPDGAARTTQPDGAVRTGPAGPDAQRGNVAGSPAVAGPAADAGGQAADDVGESGQLPGGTVAGALNEQNTAPGAEPAPAQAPTETPAAVAGDAAGAKGVPAAAGAGLEAAGVNLKKTKAEKDAELDHLFGIPQKRAAALDRIAKGKGWFGAADKAAKFIAANGLKDTHEAVKTSATRWDVVAKQGSQPTEKANGTQADQAQQTRPQPEAPKRGTGPQVSTPEAASVTPELVKVRDLYGYDHHVLKSELDNPEKIKLRRHNAQGERVTGDRSHVHRENIDQDGSKRAATAKDMPYIARDGDLPFKTKASLLTAMKRRGATEATHEVRDVNGGFVAVRKATDTKLNALTEQAETGNKDDIRHSRIANGGVKIDKAEVRPYRRADGSVGYEAVPIIPKQEDGQQDELDAEMRSYEAKAPAAKPDPLTEQEKAAKAKMLGAAAKLATLLSKNTRANITPEQEQAMLPIVIELFDGAMALGYVKFKQAARYVREYIANAIDQDAADSIPIDTLQGAYIATARRHADKDITPKKDVIAVESVDELTEELEKPAKQADTGANGHGNATQQLDQPSTGALEGTPAQDVRAPESGRDTGAGPDRSGAGDLFGDASPDDTGGNAGRGVGANPRAVPVPARGTRADAQDAKKPRVSRSSRTAKDDGLFGAAGGIAPEAGANPAPNAPAIPAPQPADEDFTITDELALGEGGQKTKFKNNIAAIRLMRDLESTGHMATPDEQAVLAKYVGWGGLPQAFDANNSDWAKEHAEITALMSPEELASARQSTRYAHYTSREIIQDGIYAALRQFGFTGGKTLEAGAGVGNFIGMMPADMRSAGRFTAIEREPFSSAIARQLYPQQNVQRADFTEFKGNDAYFDAAVGNPPFASDPQTDRSGRKHLSGLSLHNYFFAKSIDMLREGGIMAQVVTNSFMDAKGDRARKYMSDRVEFLGAIRLPNSAFAKNANTEVTTDIIFLKKRPDSEVGGKAAREDAKRWLNTGTYTDKNGQTVALNQYFIDNQNMMLGDFGAFGTMYGPDQPALVAKAGQDTLALLKEAVGRLPAGVYKSIAETGTDSQVDAAVVALKNPEVKEGGYFMQGDKLMQRLPDIAGEALGVEVTPLTQWTEKTALGEAGFERIKALSGMRATVRGLLGAEMADSAEAMKTLRKTLNEQYDAYRDTHGLINDPSTLRVFEDDPDFPLLASLEHGYTPGIGPASAKRMGVKPAKSTAKKGPIFTQRVVAARQAVQKVETPADALVVSMAERGKLDAAYIGQLLGMEPDAVLKELSTGDKPLLFRDPATDEYVLRDAYLSGNVRAKLAQAKAAGMFTNINELDAVQPEDVGSHEIVARLGSPWVPIEVYRDFAQSLFGEESKAHVFYLKANSSFQVMVNGASEVAMSNTWGTPAYPGDALLQALMNNRSIKVTFKDSEGKTHTDIDATEKANTKGQEIKEKFNDWLFSDPERSELLTKAYNETNNNYVTRVYEGSNMTFPGKVPDGIIKFRRHQRNAIARIVQDRTTLLDHVVGAGKTFTVVAGAMELKRTGLARKPMVAVPNHLVKQWAADFYRLYPGANVLTATKKDFEKANRRKFLARIATGDWDAVVIAHSSFGFIKPAPEFEAEFNGREISKIMATIKAVDDSDGDKQTKKRTIKQLEAMKERLENRIRQLRDKPMDDLLDFEQIGVDQLFVDEAHMFKNLMYTTKMQGVAGLNDPTGSQRAYDMYVKTNQVMEKNGRGQGVVFATGTPVSNSLAEMYHMMRYLMPAQMKELGFESFDAWANTYASVEQVWMQAPSGDGFKATNRMSNFVNTPELLKMFDQVSDTVTMDDIKKAYSEENDGAEFPLPKLKGGRRTPVSLEKSKAQDDYMADIAKRALAIEKRRGPPKKGDDNILVVMSDARKAAMDIRLVDPNITEREAGGRIDRSTDEVVARYKKFDAVKGTQIVFSDLGTPLKHAKKELKEYEELHARVLAGTDDVAASATLGNEAAIATMEDAESAQAELDAMGPDWQSAVKAALRGFSIYDDFKAALIEKGVPEAEIAFIHDYNTDDQKASLFRKVNAGHIRVLLGSTAKLGAGTNVQERLVAEHHLDVPWRPSDVEQREGRIERQGNRLMNEWPNFEIEILAYVTRDTLDMRMWQVQETKLKMINQLRTRKIGREIDNAFEDMELSAGEMQAAATGDINLLKEIQLRNDVKKLEQRRRSFEGQRNDLISRKRRNAEMLRDLPTKLSAAKTEAEFAAAYRKDLAEDPVLFKMNIDGKEYTDAEKAQAVLREKDEATEDVTDLAGEVTKKKAPLSVKIDGETVKNRATMAELFSNARGDREPIKWTVKGEHYRRRSVLANAIRTRVNNAMADETVEPVGSLGDYSVAVEGSSGKDGETILEVTLSRAGKVMLSSSMHIADTGSAPTRVINVAENLLESALREADYLQRSLDRAQKEARELDKTDVAGVWPDQGKLDAARDAHKDVLAQLKKKEEAAAPAAPEAAAGDDETPMYSRDAAPEAPDVSDEQTGISVALLELGKNTGLYQYPKSDAKDVPAIATAKNVKAVPVTKAQMTASKIVAVQNLAMNMSDKPGAKFWLVRTKENKLGVITEIDNEVYIDVSVGRTGTGGSAIYDTAMNYAANNPGKVFIGDPNDLSKAAMSRRLENMLSAAVKYGSTDFMAPHQYQIEGRYGFAPLEWTKGETLANIRAMVDASVAATAKTNPIATSNVKFDPATQSFHDWQDQPLDAGRLSEMLGFDGRTPGVGSAGVSTLQRNALYRALLSGADARRALLDAVRGQQDSGSTNPSGALKGAFYSRGSVAAGAQQRLSEKEIQSIIEAVKARWKNAPEIVLAKSMDDDAIPQKVRDHNSSMQQSQGAEGAPEGFFYKGKVYVVADQIGTPNDVLRVLFHETLGHAGLRGVFGDVLKPILKQIAALRRGEVAAKAKEYGLDMTKEADRLVAAEEVLANMAETRPELGFVKRAIAAIRTWLRANVPGFEQMELTDAEIIRSYILPARGWIENGQGAAAADALPALSRAKSDQTDTPAFRKWFGDSKVVDDQGKPLVVYRGEHGNGDGQPRTTLASYTFVDDAKVASTYAMSPNDTRNFLSAESPKVIPAFLSIQKPIIENRDDPFVEFSDLAQKLGRDTAIKFARKHADWIQNTSNWDENFAGEYDSVDALMDANPSAVSELYMDAYPLLDDFAFVGAAQDAGFDGAIHVGNGESMDAVEYRAFRPEQIKSAIGNRGTFDPASPDIMYSRASMGSMTSRAMESLNEAFSHPGKLSFWDKSVGSMYHLAERHPPFKRVFNAAQNFINDVSFFATEAAELAPKILPRLDTWRDLTKTPISAEDNKAIASPILEGTLSWTRDEDGKPVRVEDAQEGAGIVWTDTELRDMFKLTDGQIALYREFRAATDKSLDNIAKADLLRFVGRDADDLRGIVMDAPDVDAAAKLLRGELLVMADADPERKKVLGETADQVLDRAERATDLKKNGYAPLSRFGRFTVDVVVDGERQYFSLFDSERAANQMAAKMRKEYGPAAVTQGTLSQREFEAFQGITPESLELFGNMLGLDSTGDEAQDQVFQTYLKLTKANRSAMKRLIHRKGIAGYSDDMGRVLAAFVYSNARQTSAALHMGELGEAVQKIPKSQGELKDVAIELSSYIKQPREEAQALRGLMFAQYLGGSIASAFVNFTQPFTVSFPYLSQYGGAARAAKQLAKAMADQRDGVKLEDDLARALKVAEEQGVVAPQEVHQLMAQARGTATLKSGDGTRAGEALASAGNAFTKLALGWGKLFGMAEQINRRSTFIAAYRMAVEQRIANPAGFATKAVNETQFINNKANKAKWARGAVGATLMTFKSYSVNYLELMHRLATQNGPEGKKAAALMLGMLLLVAGGGGLPFAEDLDDAIDFLAQRMGYNFSSKRAKREFLEGLFGKAGAQFVEHGITGLPGSPVDVSGRMSMANLIPGTGLLLKKTDHSRDIQELLGPVGDLVKRGFKATDLALSGEFGKAALEASPRAVANFAKGVDMANTGIYTDTRGRKVIETTGAEALAKAIGFQPQSVARVQESSWQVQNLIAQTKLRESEIAERWAQGLFEGNKEKVADARQSLQDWNEKNPDTRIKISMPQIIKRVRAMRMGKEERIAKTAPKEIRATVQRELALE